MADLIVDLSTSPLPTWTGPRATIYTANACDVLSYLKDVDGVMTAPPWYQNQYCETCFATHTIAHQADVTWYSQSWVYFASWMSLVQQTGAHWGFYFISFDHAPAFLRVARIIGWQVQHAWPVAQAEWLFYIGSTPLRDTDGMPELLTQYGPLPTKPYLQLIDLLRRQGLTPEHQILDPFCGHGSSLVAAYLLGAQVIGIDARPERTALAAAALQELTPMPSDVQAGPHWRRRFHGSKEQQY